MLDSLQFVRGAVSRKDFVPALNHFRIQDGRVLGYNGVVALSSPIGLDLKCTPRASELVKALRTCEGETTQLSLSPNGRLAIKAGSFRAFVECTPDTFPEVAPEGDAVDLAPEAFEGIRDIVPFIAEDASRPWARGILLYGASAFATNNIVLVERWLATPIPRAVNIPEEAVTELLRVGEVPTRMQFGGNTVTFHFPGDRWLRTSTLTLDWPPVQTILERPDSATPPPANLFEALKKVAPFVDDTERVYLRPGVVTTSTADNAGASHDVPGLEATACFNVHQLIGLERVVDRIDLGAKGPCPFYGPSLRGVIVGMLEG